MIQNVQKLVEARKIGYQKQRTCVSIRVERDLTLKKRLERRCQEGYVKGWKVKEKMGLVNESKTQKEVRIYRRYSTRSRGTRVGIRSRIRSSHSSRRKRRERRCGIGEGGQWRRNTTKGVMTQKEAIQKGLGGTRRRWRK